MGKDIISYYNNEFEIEVLEDTSNQLTIFNYSFSNSQTEQIKIFNRLEKNIPFVNAASFSNHVHFQNSYQIPVQRWYPYREGYSIKLVNAFIKELNISGNIFDPFSGSGTTLLSARLNNLNSFGIDVNPISIIVSKVENQFYRITEIAEIESEIQKFKNLPPPNKKFETKFDLADKVFNSSILQALLYFKDEIKAIGNQNVQDVFFVAWLAIMEDVSNIKKEGNGIKYKNRKRTPSGYINIDKDEWEEKSFPQDKFSFVKAKLLSHLELILFDLKNNFGPCTKVPKIFHGSSLNFNSFFNDEIQFTFYSPPYCNCFDYFEIHKVELWLGDFISNKEEFRVMRNSGFRSNTNALNHKPIIYTNHYLEDLISLFDESKLWNNRIPTVVRGYFDDTYSFLNNLFQQTTNGGFVGVVIGNSAYSGVIIPSDLILAEIAKEVGFKIKNIFITRHLTTSSQQKQELEGLKNYLRESIVLLEK